jgi:penicillin-binding protein-related factor A (putative recombinase)
MNCLYYLLDGVDLINYIDNNESSSIPYEYIKNKGYIIKEGYQPAIDYIKVIDILIKENNYEKNGK